MVQLRDGRATQPPSGPEAKKQHSSPPSQPQPSTPLSQFPYTNCFTRILDLKHLHSLPIAKNASEDQYRQIFRDYVDASSRSITPKDSLSCTTTEVQSRAEEARLLQIAVTSLTTGIAPPVAFPTETVYGLGADATNPASIAGIFAAKGRPGDNPLIVHVSSTAHLERCLGGSLNQSAIPEIYHDLLRDFWPGPLTVLLPVPPEGKGVKFAPNVHPGQNTIGFRCPESAYARFLISVCDRPIAAPSANSSGKPSPTSAQHVLDDLRGKINFILDGGDCHVGVESTVVDGLGETPVVLRPGGLGMGELRRWGKLRGNAWAGVVNGWEAKGLRGAKRKRAGGEVNGTAQKALKIADEEERIGNVYDSPAVQTPKNETENLEMEDDAGSEAPRAPGMKYKHYAPTGRMYLFEGRPEKTIQSFYDTLAGVLRNRTTAPKLEAREPSDCPKSTSKDDLTYENTPTGLRNGQAHRLNIGLLTSTSWPPTADLLNKWVDANKGHVGKVSSTPRFQEFELRLDLDEDNVAARTVGIYSFDMGTDARSVARHLFGCLRSCDSLGCDWIFAEAPSQDAKSEDGDDDFETVLERMRKAASEIIEV